MSEDTVRPQTDAFSSVARLDSEVSIVGEAKQKEPPSEISAIHFLSSKGKQRATDYDESPPALSEPPSPLCESSQFILSTVQLESCDGGDGSKEGVTLPGPSSRRPLTWIERQTIHGNPEARDSEGSGNASTSDWQIQAPQIPLDDGNTTTEGAQIDISAVGTASRSRPPTPETVLRGASEDVISRTGDQGEPQSEGTEVGHRTATKGNPGSVQETSTGQHDTMASILYKYKSKVSDLQTKLSKSQEENDGSRRSKQKIREQQASLKYAKHQVEETEWLIKNSEQFSRITPDEQLSRLEAWRSERGFRPPHKGSWLSKFRRRWGDKGGTG